METTTTPVTSNETTAESIDQTQTPKEIKSDDAITRHFKDYNGLLEYCIKLMEENKNLLSENRDLHKASEMIVKMGIELQEQNENLKNEKDKLVEGSISMMEFNQELMESKTNLEEDLRDIKKRYANLLDLLSAGIQRQLLELGDDDNETGQGDHGNQATAE